MATAVGLAVGCSLITNAYDFSIGPQDGGADIAVTPDAGTRDPRVCAHCPENPTRPPCAPSSEADAGAESPRFFAVRSVDFGERRADWSSADYSTGIDQDCSSREDGGLPDCKPHNAASTWSALPHGIDNAFATQVLAPIAENAFDAGAVMLSTSISDAFAAGRDGLLIEVEQWNGQSDDQAVSVSLYPSRGPTSHGTPTFAIDESWDVYPNDKISTSNAYVASGTLVADFGNGENDVWLRASSGARVKLPIFGVVLIGSVASATPRFVVAASVQSLGQQIGFDHDIAQAAFGCGVKQSDPLTTAVQNLLGDAFDLGPKGQSCKTMSVGISLPAARVMGIGTQLGCAPVSCGPSACDDAGAPPIDASDATPE